MPFLGLAAYKTCKFVFYQSFILLLCNNATLNTGNMWYNIKMELLIHICEAALSNEALSQFLFSQQTSDSKCILMQNIIFI